MRFQPEGVSVGLAEHGWVDGNVSRVGNRSDRISCWNRRASLLPSTPPKRCTAAAISVYYKYQAFGEVYFSSEQGRGADIHVATTGKRQMWMREGGQLLALISRPASGSPFSLVVGASWALLRS